MKKNKQIRKKKINMKISLPKHNENIMEIEKKSLSPYNQAVLN